MTPPEIKASGYNEVASLTVKASIKLDDPDLTPDDRLAILQSYLEQNLITMRRIGLAYNAAAAANAPPSAPPELPPRQRRSNPLFPKGFDRATIDEMVQARRQYG